MTMFYMCLQNATIISFKKNIQFKAPLWNPDREILVKSWKNQGKSGFLRGQILKFLKFRFFFLIVLIVYVLCENSSKNKARLLILEQTQFLRVLTRKYWFSVNMPSQKGHNYWTQPPKTMKFCQNVPHMYILKVKKFRVSAYLRLDSIKKI